MRVVALVVLAACGRVGFDETSARSADAANDAVDRAIDTAPAASRVLTISGNGAAPAQLFEMNLGTGQLTLLGSVPASFGTITGLATWDANTLYASSATAFVKIRLSPFTVTADTSPGGDYAAIERNGLLLSAIAEGDNHVVSFDPGSVMGIADISTLPTTGQGGDITRSPDGSWYWFSNTTKQLYSLDPAAGTATALGGTANGAPFMTGLVSDENNNLFVIGQRIYPISKTTGQLGTSITACVSCPTATLLQSGDTTRMP